MFACSSRARGCPAPGYPIIVGSGPNAAVMHYEAADGLVEAGHLVLVDAGAEWRWVKGRVWVSMDAWVTRAKGYELESGGGGAPCGHRSRVEVSLHGDRGGRG